MIKDFHLFSRRFENKLLLGFNIDPDEKYVITIADGPFWKKIRTIMRASFSSAKLKAMVPLIDESVNTFMDIISKKSQNKEEVDVFSTYRYLTIEVIAKTAFGISLDCQNTQSNNFIREFESFINGSLPITAGASIIIGRLNFVLECLQLALYHLGIIKRKAFIKYAEKIVQNRIKSGEKRKDLLQCLIDTHIPIHFTSKNEDLTVDDNVAKDDAVINGVTTVHEEDKSFTKLTPSQITPNCSFLLAAGFETTRTALSFITHCLVTHPDVQEKVRDEVNQLLKQDGKLDYNTVTNLPYLDAVIKESLRLYPPATTITKRVSSVDYKYKDIVIPKGTQVIIPIPLVHRDETIWTNPDTFNLERFFDPENKVEATMYIPFGAGSRICIGMRLALLEIKLTLAKLLSRFRIEPGPNTCLSSLPLTHLRETQKPKDGVMVKFFEL